MKTKDPNNIKCRRVSLECREEVLPNGIKMFVDRVVFPKSVAVLPIWRKERTTVLVRQYRPAVREWLLEAPAGTQKEGESPEEAALRELKEEAGLTTKELERVNEGFVSPGYSTEYMTLFIAWDPEPSDGVPEPHEVLERLVVSLDEAFELLRKGKIRDLKTMLLLMIARRRLDEETWR
ncbi:MAG: NUDIX hydrolase [Acidilobaceae archaeon]